MVEKQQPNHQQWKISIQNNKEKKHLHETPSKKQTNKENQNKEKNNQPPKLCRPFPGPVDYQRA